MRTTLALLFVLLSTPVFAQEKILSPYFFVEGVNPSVESFPLKSANVIVIVSGVIAEVTVWQIDENQGATPSHARYVFPGSTRAAVHGMRIRVGDQAVVAKIQERQKP